MLVNGVDCGVKPLAGLDVNILFFCIEYFVRTQPELFCLLFVTDQSMFAFYLLQTHLHNLLTSRKTKTAVLCLIRKLDWFPAVCWKAERKRYVILFIIKVIDLWAPQRISFNTVALYVLSALKVPIIQNQYKFSRRFPTGTCSCVTQANVAYNQLINILQEEKSLDHLFQPLQLIKIHVY